MRERYSLLGGVGDDSVGAAEFDYVSIRVLRSR